MQPSSTTAALSSLAHAASSRDNSPYSSPARSPSGWSGHSGADDSAIEVDYNAHPAAPRALKTTKLSIARPAGAAQTQAPKSKLVLATSGKAPALHGAGMMPMGGHYYPAAPGARAPHAARPPMPPMSMQQLEEKRAEFMAWYDAQAAQLGPAYPSTGAYPHAGHAAQHPRHYGHGAAPQHTPSAWGYPQHPQQHHDAAPAPGGYSPHHHHHHHHHHNGHPSPVAQGRAPVPRQASPITAQGGEAQRTAASRTLTAAEAGKAKKEKKAVYKRSTGPHPATTPAGTQRPAESYAQLAANAIRANPEQRASVKQIYQWVETAHPFYKQQGAPWWKNCIRHNLSMKSCFLRHPNAGGMGVHLWTISPDATPADFAPSRRRTAAAPAKEKKAPSATKSSKTTTKRDKTTSKLGIIRRIDAPAPAVVVDPVPLEQQEQEQQEQEQQGPPSPGGQHTGAMMSLLAAAAGAPYQAPPQQHTAASPTEIHVV